MCYAEVMILVIDSVFQKDSLKSYLKRHIPRKYSVCPSCAGTVNVWKSSNTRDSTVSAGKR